MGSTTEELDQGPVRRSNGSVQPSRLSRVKNISLNNEWLDLECVLQHQLISAREGSATRTLVGSACALRSYAESKVMMPHSTFTTAGASILQPRSNVNKTDGNLYRDDDKSYVIIVAKVGGCGKIRSRTYYRPGLILSSRLILVSWGFRFPPPSPLQILVKLLHFLLELALPGFWDGRFIDRLGVLGPEQLPKLSFRLNEFG